MLQLSHFSLKILTHSVFKLFIVLIGKRELMRDGEGMFSWKSLKINSPTYSGQWKRHAKIKIQFSWLISCAHLLKPTCHLASFWHSERLIGLPDSMMRNKSRPQLVPSLEGLFIEDIAVGCEHVLALSSTGDVYTWGCNSEGQVNNVL